MKTTTLNDKEIALGNALVEAVNKAVNDTLLLHDEDPEQWVLDPPMLDDIMDLLAKAQQLPFRIAYVRQFPDQFGRW